MTTGDITLSVCIVTYNQEKYIKQAIESVLEQKTDFTYEVIIGDDGSTDGAREIMTSYKKKHPGLINLIFHQKKNEGPPGAVNFISNLSAAKGKYIALLDGDDYWCDTNKLQKQVGFLEANPGYAICCHRVYKKRNNQRAKLYPDEYVSSTEADYSIEMMARHGNLVSTPSVVYRNKLFTKLPAWYVQAPVGDYPLHMLNSQFGKIKYFPDAMAVHREHSTGAWSGQSVKTNAANMMKTISFLLTEPFEENVKSALKVQLRENEVVYLTELLYEDWDLFRKEFDGMMNVDKTIAGDLVKKIKTDLDSVHQSRAYKVMEKLQRIIRR